MIPRKPAYRKTPCRRTLPNGNDPHLMVFKTLSVVERPYNRSLNLQFHHTTYSDREKFEQYSLLFRITSTRQLVCQQRAIDPGLSP